MTIQDKKSEDDGSFLEFVAQMACNGIDLASIVSETGFLSIIIVIICLLALMTCGIVSLLFGKKKSLPKIKDIKPESMHFHVISKKKIIKILCIDALLILGLIAAWDFGVDSLITTDVMYLLMALIFIGTLSLIISCDMHAIISADEDNLYISYDYLFYKKKVKKVQLRRIKKIMITDDKVKIMTNFRHILLTVEPDSEAYAYFLRLKKELNV